MDAETAPTAELLPPGAMLCDRYRVGARIGQGGMGVVFRAEDVRTGAPVAVKALFVPRGMPGEVHRFQREFRALARLAHPHVVAVHDYGQLNGVPYYVMEYVAGVDLHRLRQEHGGQLPLSVTLALLEQLCDALAYVHAQGIVHRDIKPSNMMVVGWDDPQARPSVKLMDFGLAQFSEVSARITQSGTLLGTVLYMAPEQAQGLPVDRRADLYALGAVLYEMLSGRPPFNAEEPMAILLQHLTREPEPLRRLRPDVPEPLAGIVHRLLAKRPAERFAGADEVWAALHDAAASRVLAPPAVMAAGPARADVVFRAGLVGRAAELAQLDAWLAAAWVGGSRFVLVEGEAGVGKTRLVAELAGQARFRGGRRLSGACFEREQLPYSPIVAALQEALSTSSGEDDADSLVAGLEGDLSRLLPGLSQTVVLAAAPELDPGQARLRLFDAVTQVFSRLAARRPLLLVLDDLHWADAATLELIHYLLRNTASGVRLLVVGTSRREERGADHPLTGLLQGLRREKLLETLALDRLAPAETEALLAGLLAVERPPEGLAARLYRESEGNPFFVEEVLKALVEEGVLVQRGGEWVLGAAAEAAGTRLIPASVSDVIQRRLAPLAAASRQALDGAAVLGREFAFDVLCGMLGWAEDALLDALDDLLRARLLEEARSTREDRYRFAHAKILEVAYCELSAARRRRLHRAAGAALERVYAARLDTPEVAGQLAGHCAASGDVARALHYGRRAGDLARRVYANEEACAYYRRALETVADGVPDEHVDEVLAIQSGLGEVCCVMGEYDQAVAAYQAVLELLPRGAGPAGKRPVAAAEAWRQIARAREVQGRYEDAFECLRRGFAVLGREEDFPAEAARLYAVMGWVLVQQSEYDRAIQACLTGLQFAGQAQDERTIADIDGYLGVVYERKGDYGRAIEYHEASLQVKTRLDDKDGMARTFTNLGTIYWLQGHLQEARDSYERSLELCTAIGHRLGMAMVLNNLGNISADLGRSAESIAYYQRTLAICRQIGNAKGIAMAYGNLAETYEAMGQLDAALDYLQQAAAIGLEQGDRGEQADVFEGLARVYLARGELDLAMKNAQLAWTTAAEIGNRGCMAEALAALGRVHMAQGDRAAGIECMRDAKRQFDELGNQARSAQLAAELDELTREGLP